MLIPKTGVTYSDAAKVTEGVTLISPMMGETVFLVDEDGQERHSWTTGHSITKWAYLTDKGTLVVNEASVHPIGVGLTSSGVISEYDWDGNLLWRHEDPGQHHDARRLADGAVYLANVPLSEDQKAQVKGGIPGTETEGGPFGEVVREVDEQGNLRWEWPFTNLGFDRFPLHPNANRWVHGHANTVFPMDDGRYLISCKVMNLLFIIDPKTNAIDWTYQNDDMGGQHDAQMLGNGNILIFANGAYARDLHQSQVWELNPDTTEIEWRYRQKDNPFGMFSPMVSGAQRLTSGNTLICEGAKGCVFEVTPAGDVVWEYINPVFNAHDALGQINCLFRARKYHRAGPEIANRI